MTSESGLDAMMRRYNKEDLLKIRASVKTDGEIATKINRTSIGAQALAFVDGSFASKARSKSSTTADQYDRSSSNITNPYDGFEDPPSDEFFFRNKAGHSPTPSVRGRKAREFIEQHGSPPGVRVTAGGKIVHDGPYPLPNSPSGAREIVPRVDFGMLENPQVSVLQGCLLSLGDGRVVQMIDGQAVPVGFVNGPLELHMPATNEHFFGAAMPEYTANGGPTNARQPQSSPFHVGPKQQPALFREREYLEAPGAAASEQLVTNLENHQVKLGEDLRMLDRNAALGNGRTQQLTHRQVVDRRVGLINAIDNTRRQIVNARYHLARRNAAGATAYAAYGVPFGQPHPMFYGAPPPVAMSYAHGVGIPMVAGLSAPAFEPPHPTPADDSQSTFNLVPDRRPSAGPAGTVSHGEEQDTSQVKNGSSGTPCLGVQQPRLTPSSKFQPGAPEFVPSTLRTVPTAHKEKAHSTASELQERSPNVGGPLRRPGNLDIDVAAKRPQNVVRNTAFINLDGSAHQPRQSHAVEIRRPNEPPKSTTLTSATLLTNPGRSQGEENTRYVASRQNSDLLEQSPEQKTVATSQGSVSSSASTGDFFPRDAPQHSLRNWSTADQTKPATLFTGNTADRERTSSEKHLTPVKPALKYQFSEESPGEELNPGLSDPDKVARLLHSFGSYLGRSPDSGRDYARGYCAGLSLGFANAAEGEDYLKGYRDGLLRAAKGGKEPSTSPTVDHPLAFDTSLESSRSKLPPKVPANTAFNTPRRGSSAAAMDEPCQTDTDDAGSKLMGSSSHSFLAANPAEKILAHNIASASTSPLSDRRTSNNGQAQNPGGRGGRIFSAPKVPTSTAHSAQHVNGRFISQLDGSYDDDDQTVLSDIPNASANRPVSPSADQKSKQKAPGSPIKRASSRASSAVRQLTSLGGLRKDKPSEEMSRSSGMLKKEEDPSKMSSPDKARWKAKWQRRFVDLKAQEEAEIQEYQKHHPV